VPPSLSRLVRRCLQKDPGARYQSTRDLVIDLEEILAGDRTGDADRPATTTTTAARPRRPVALIVAGAIVVAVAAVAVTRTVAPGQAPASVPRYHRVTFRHGSIDVARFAPDGRQIVYASAVDGKLSRVFVTTPENPEGRAITGPGVGLFAVSSTGMMALRMLHPEQPYRWYGQMLATAPLDGGAPRQIMDAVREADWSPDGSELAVVHIADGAEVLEYPIGTRRFETHGHIVSPRVSPDGQAVAFLHWPIFGDDRGTVEVVRRDGSRKTLTESWMSTRGLAWSPDGKEIWFGASARGDVRGVRAVTMAGRDRLLTEGPSSIILEDVSRDGRVLVDRDLRGRSIIAVGPGQSVERDISWLDLPFLVDLSRDGRRVLFFEGGEAANQDIVSFYRDLDGSPAVRLGEGIAFGLAPDGKTALMSPDGPYVKLMLVPTGTGAPQTLPAGRIARYTAGAFLDDGKRVAIGGFEEGRRGRVWLQKLEGGDPWPITDEGYSLAVPCPQSVDGASIVGRDPDGHPVLLYFDGRPPHRLDIAPSDALIQFIDERRALVRNGAATPARLSELDLATGRQTPWRELAPPDNRGDVHVFKIQVTRDRQAFAYQVIQDLRDIYLITGLK
jgi:hypothetical protein